MIVLLAALGGLLAGTALAFPAVFALLQHLQWKIWIAVPAAAILSLLIGVLAGGVAAAGLISVMYPEFNWNF